MTHSEESNAPWLAPPTANMKIAQENDTDLKIVMKWLSNKEKPPWKEMKKCSSELRAYWSIVDTLTIQEGLILKKRQADAGGSTPPDTSRHFPAVAPYQTGWTSRGTTNNG
jgi:hypothetical protein